MSENSYWEQPSQVAVFARREPDKRLLQLLRTFDDPKSTRVLDLGAAGGRNTVVLAEQGFDFFALDSAKAMVETIRDRVGTILGRKEANRRVRRGAMSDLDFEAEWFDLVIALGILQNARTRSEFDRAVSETARVLKTGGQLLVANFSPRLMPNGRELQPVPAEPHVYEGAAAGPMFLLEAPQLDEEMAKHGLVPVVATDTVVVQTDPGRRVTVNAHYQKAGTEDTDSGRA